MTMVWRAVSAVVVIAALGITAWGLFEGVNASARDRAATEPANDVGQSADVRVVGFGDPEGMSVSVLSVTNNDPVTVNARAAAEGALTPAVLATLNRSGTTPIVIALTRSNGSLAGLAWVTPDAWQANIAEGGTTITLSPQSTAQALVALAPSVLNPDLDVTQARLDEVKPTVEFETLIAEVARVEDLRSANDRLERALAGALDRIPARPESTDPGCDSVAGSAAITAAGTCVVALRNATSMEVLNGQNRWAIVYDAESAEACAVVAPRPATMSFRADQDCPFVIDIAAPGPVAAGAGPLVQEQVAVAALVTAFGDYAAPFAEQALGASGLAAFGSTDALTSNPMLVDQSFGALAASTPEVTTLAATISDPTVPAPQRTAALLALSRASLTSAVVPEAIFGDSFVPNADGAALLLLFERALEQRVGGTGPPTWTAAGWERVDLSQLMERAGG